MRYETIHNMQIPKVGFGTWTIGGEGMPNPAADAGNLRTLHSALELGYTHFDTAEVYAAGHSEELLGQAIHQARLPRETLFITSKVSPDHLQYTDILRCCDASLKRLGMEYLDLYLIHWPRRGMKLEDSFRALNELVRTGKVRHLGVSNFNLKLLQKAVALSATPLLTNQVSYSVPDKTCVKNGVLAYCQQNDILLTAYSPLKPRNIRSNPALKAIAQAHGVTHFQVALTWLVMQPRVITIPMSADPRHQAQNLQAADLLLSPDEMEQLSFGYSQSA
jgi:diketogulonate reductase-like aldo/keto reductase